MLADVRIFVGFIENLLGANPTRVEKGIYVDCGFNFDNCVPLKLTYEENYPNFAEYKSPEDDGDWFLDSYGVVDSIENFKQVYKKIIDCPRRVFTVGFTEVIKSEQEESGGWRWHKWGGYYGSKNPQHEYLYDEDDSIQSVLTFKIIEITNKVMVLGE